MPNWKAKRSNNFEHKKKGFTPNQNFGNNNACNFPNKNSKEINVTHSQTLMALEIKNLLIITATTLRIMNVKN